MIKRYGVKTRSGSNYYIEDHTHLLGRPTWLIFVGNSKYFIIMLSDNPHDESSEVTPYENILSIEQFRNKHIIFFQEKVDIKDRATMAMWQNTSVIDDVIIFK